MESPRLLRLGDVLTQRTNLLRRGRMARDEGGYKRNANTLFGTGELSSGFFAFSVTPGGVAVNHDYAVAIGDSRLHFDAGTKLTQGTQLTPPRDSLLVRLIPPVSWFRIQL